MHRFIFLRGVITFCRVLYCVYLNWWLVREIGNYVSSIHTKFYCIIYSIKAVFIIFFIIFFGFYIDSAFRIASYILFIMMLTFIALFRIKSVYMAWTIVFFIGPFFWLSEFMIRCFDWKCFKLWKKKKVKNINRSDFNQKNEKKYPYYKLSVR